MWGLTAAISEATGARRKKSAAIPIREPGTDQERLGEPVAKKKAGLAMRDPPEPLIRG
jgi:hypothetical protein